MHIPENYLSPSTCAVMTIAMVPVWRHAIHKVKQEIPKAKIPLLGVGAAFSFLGMMFNIPLPGGTTGHAVGGTLIALLLGPEAACISVTIALLIQALLFGDGGILAFGANCFNMAFVLPFVGYGIYRLLTGKNTDLRRRLFAAAIASYVGINAAAFCAAIQFGIQPILFHDASGQALYCPYGLNVSIPSMMIGHLTLFGLAELIFTTAIFAFLLKTSPNLVREGKKAELRPVWMLLLLLIAAVPLGLLAQGTAWGEWGSDEIAQVTSAGSVLGYTPGGMLHGFSFTSLLPDYSMAGLPDVTGYILSAAIGVSLMIIFFKLVSTFMKEKTDFSQKQKI